MTMPRTLSLLLLTLMAAPVLARQQPDLGTEAQRAAGKVLYDQKCAQCHGLRGDGQGYATPFLRPEPRDFTAGTFKFRSTVSGELPATDDLRRSIHEGMPYTSMPAWKGVLSDADIDNLVYYLKTFSDDFSGPFGVPERVPLPDKAPAFDADHLARGREVFEENQCTDCHGMQGRGDGKSAPTLTDDWGLPIRPADLTKRWTFRSARTRADIYRTFMTGLSGSPMPAYDNIEEADRWALVDYIWSLSRDEPDYATAVFSQPVAGPLDLADADALFADAPPAYFPVVGQVIEPGRAFHPGVNGLEVRAVHNADEIAFRLSWHDMSAETEGQNGPDLPVPRFDPADTLFQASDAVAIQVPAAMPAGTEKPYFLFGDRKHAVHLWFVDLARGTAQVYEGKGSGDVHPTGGTLETTAAFDAGEWTVTMKRARTDDDGLSFEEGTFVPIAFSVWDGFEHERGNKRGVTSWYYVYVEPLEQASALGPMLLYGLSTLVLCLGLVFFTRRKYRHAA